MYVAGMALVFTGGIVLSGAGFNLLTWQYWAISIPLIIGSMMVGAAK